MRALSFPIAFAAAALSAASASAHGIWLSERFGGLAIVYGVGPQDEAYDPAKIKEAKAFSAGGAATPITVKPNGNHATVSQDPAAAVISVLFDNGFWAKGPDGKWINRSKTEVPGATASSHSLKFNVTHLAPGAATGKAQGHLLEIIPLTDPAALKPGAELPVQVLYEGKPLAGAAVFPDYVNDANTRAEGKTGADGKITLKVRNHGWNVIGVSHGVPMADTMNADRRSMFSTLSFRTVYKEE